MNCWRNSCRKKIQTSKNQTSKTQTNKWRFKQKNRRLLARWPGSFSFSSHPPHLLVFEFFHSLTSRPGFLEIIRRVGSSQSPRCCPRYQWSWSCVRWTRPGEPGHENRPAREAEAVVTVGRGANVPEEVWNFNFTQIKITGAFVPSFHVFLNTKWKTMYSLASERWAYI